jgi:hypothetical protein
MNTTTKVVVLAAVRNLALVGIIISVIGALANSPLAFMRMQLLIIWILAAVVAFFARRYCVTQLKQLQKESPDTFAEAVRASWFLVGGFCLGAFLGFLLRPSAALVGQLPFMVVLTRGASLQGMDQILVPLARTSFNYLLFGGIIGGAVGFIAPRFLTVKK